MSTDSRLVLADELFRIGCLKFGSFKLKLHERDPTAPLSPIYIDLRLIRSSPAALTAAIDCYERMTRQLEFDVIADVPTAATPITAVLCYRASKPMISPRKDEKTHGLGRKIDGIVRAGNRALVVDDLITAADSKLEAIRALESNGIVVRDVVVLVDREQGGVDALAQHGYACHVTWRISDLLKYYADSGKIEHHQLVQTLAYLAGKL